MISKVLPSITTATKHGSTWREKIKEVNELKLKEVALFPTCLEKKERKELYSLLEKSTIRSIPFVHLRSDMELWELDYLVSKFKTKAFNIHTQREYPMIHDYLKYKEIIYIENTYKPLDEKEIKEFGGICLDLAHLENRRRVKDKFQYNIKLIEKYPIGCNHVSAIWQTSHVSSRGVDSYDRHWLKDFSQLDYLKRYPLKYFSPLVAVELENPIKEQLKIRDYIIKIIKSKK